jgi:multidrug resistance efflux pump
LNGNQTQSQLSSPNHRPIPTPLRVRWVHFRYQLLPVLTVILCSLLATMLWMRHAGSGNAIGEVAIERITVITTVDGVLVDLPGRVIKPHDRVRQGDEVARIDTTPLEARRAQRQVDVERLRAEIKTAESNPGGSSSPGVSNEDHLKSLRTALANREEELASLNASLSSLQQGVTAPVSGTVYKIFLRPGQLAKAGEPVMEISADGSTYVVSYLREAEQYIRPTPHMQVEVRPRADPKRVVPGTVDTVGSTVESVPARQLRDQKVPEWGLPVRLTIPSDANLRPGEIVILAFKKAAP